MSGSERRATPRYRARPGTFAHYYHLGPGYVRDISLGGVYIEDHRSQFSEGTELDLELRLGDESISVRGVVQRSYPEEGFAVQFLEISSEAKERLERYFRTLLTWPDLGKKKKP